MRAKALISLFWFVFILPLSKAFPGEVSELSSFKAKSWEVPWLGLKLVRIPRGTFQMGSPPGEIGRREDEVLHNVTISKPFYMGVFEVTQGQFYKVMLPDFDHSRWTYFRGPLHAGGAFFYRKDWGDDPDLLKLDCPMESVTWEQAMAFCKKLTKIETKAGRLPEGFVFRLPTEAEWEYACRAGTKGPFNVEWDGTYEGLQKFAWVGKGSTAPVGGGRKPNAWGLYDMHGNVFEWCYDWYGPYPKGHVKDPTGPKEGKMRVARGGCFIGCDPRTQDPRLLVYPFIRSASRYSFYPNVRGYAILGFRIVLVNQKGSAPKN